MRFVSLIFLVSFALSLQAQQDEPIAVQTEHPRIFLRPQRLRLLKRERERSSARWQQFDALISGNAPMPEGAFAEALYYQVAGSAAIGQRAIRDALGPYSDLRQQAIVFDWCQDALTEVQKKDLTSRLEKAIAAPPADDSVATARSRALAAIALFDHTPQTPQKELERIVRQWWQGKVIAGLKSGRETIDRDDAYPLLELFHAMRDNTTVELRESDAHYFRDFPMEHLLTYYPPVYPAPDGEYYIGYQKTPGEPDVKLAALSRAAELAMVAYDANAQETQILQGWLMHDKYIMRGTFGTPYEYLWANPYQPGLSYYLAPLVYYNADLGKLVVRSSWEDSAKWFGYFDGRMQMFDDGRITVMNPQLSGPPITMEQAVICLGRAQRKFRVQLEQASPVFVIGLDPRRPYLVEVDDEEVFEASTDPSGILEVEVPRGKEVGIRVSPSPAATAAQ